ncbi:hypothetical protein AVEN_46108-1 [Araneus ventricosus]|uniref:Tc1-like transposase DDE domain-containing protein n=1 Tax=Araneus ventricosus TaxID=182803 RepID=A0A4Y2SHS6_ARAVE|nr:hypothetical protein AVEN_46108-1 [Araneus ventricosus]
MPSVIKPLYRTLNEASSRNGQACCPMALFSCMIMPTHGQCGGDDIAATSWWETLEHPPYSPDLSPCDFHVSGPLKQAIRGHRFTTVDEVCDWVQA